MAPTISEQEIIHNKLNVLLSKNQRFVASWPSLKRKREEESHNLKSTDEIEKEEQEIFTLTPELLGLGAILPKDGEVRREELSSNDKLRKQLLGKDYVKKQKIGANESGNLRPRTLPVGSKPKPSSIKTPVDDGSEDDGGRSSLGKSRQGTKKGRVKPEVDETSVGEARPPEGESSKESRSQKKASNYLDEVLANQSLRRRKKSKREIWKATVEAPDQGGRSAKP